MLTSIEYLEMPYSDLAPVVSKALLTELLKQDHPGRDPSKWCWTPRSTGDHRAPITEEGGHMRSKTGQVIAPSSAPGRRGRSCGGSVR